MVDLAVSAGALRLPCRVLAYRLPEEVVAPHRRRTMETARKKGRTASRASLHWLQCGWYVTNVRRDIWVPDVVATIYRIRWHIELMFKHWKSLLHRHVLSGTRPERIQCFLYGRLITMLLFMQVCA